MQERPGRARAHGPDHVAEPERGHVARPAQSGHEHHRRALDGHEHHGRRAVPPSAQGAGRAVGALTRAQRRHVGDAQPVLSTVGPQAADCPAVEHDQSGTDSTRAQRPLRIDRGQQHRHLCGHVQQAESEPKTRTQCFYRRSEGQKAGIDVADTKFVFLAWHRFLNVLGDPTALKPPMFSEAMQGVARLVDLFASVDSGQVNEKKRINFEQLPLLILGDLRSGQSVRRKAGSRRQYHPPHPRPLAVQSSDDDGRRRHRGRESRGPGLAV